MDEERPDPPPTGLGAWWDPIGAGMSVVMIQFMKGCVDGFASCAPVIDRDASRHQGNSGDHHDMPSEDEASPSICPFDPDK